MNQQPDKLFREKLTGYHKPAPASAWEKIAAAQPKKNSRGVWLRIAASLLLVAIATYLLMPNAGKVEQPQNIVAEVPTEDSDNTPETQHKQEQLPTQPEREVQQEHLAKTEQPPSRTRSVKARKIQEVTVVQETYAEPEVVASVSVPEESNSVVPATESSETIPAATPFTPAPATQNITLVFTATEVNEYLDKKALAQATSEEKKPSTLKKLLKKANNLKDNQDLFGELRQKKNEILALNFKNEKQRGQNK